MRVRFLIRKEERSSSGKKFIRVIKLNLFGAGLCYLFVRKFWRMVFI